MKNRTTPMDERDLKKLAGFLAGMPDVEPPDTLIHAIMGHIRPKRPNLFKRLWFIFQTPFSVTPFRIVAVVASVIFVLLSGGLLMRGTTDREISWITPVSQQKGLKTVILTLDFPGASRVDVIGSFNQWAPENFQMHWDEGQRIWSLALRLDGGRHEYAFLVDSKRVLPDPKALLYQDDGFGNKNSVLIIERNNGNETEI